MAAIEANLRIDGSRLWGSIMDMAKIGPGVAGDNNRQTLTDADAEGRALFKLWCDAAGLATGVDAMGTMFARREGTEAGAAPVHVGSHLDTQPTGGKYDGVLGVLGGSRDRADAERSRDPDAAPDRGDELDQRGGHAVRGLPPEKWSSLKWAFGPIGGCWNGRRSMDLKRSWRS